MSNEKATSPALIRCGRVVGVHGVRGELKAVLEVDDPETLAAAVEIRIGDANYHLVGARPHKQHYLLRLQEVTDRDQALALMGQEILVETKWLPPLPEGEYYWYQIIGLAVHLAVTDEYLGQVTAILPTPAHDVYIVQRGQEEFLVPAIAEVIEAVDLENRRLVIAPGGWVAAGGAD